MGEYSLNTGFAIAVISIVNLSKNRYSVAFQPSIIYTVTLWETHPDVRFLENERGCPFETAPNTRSQCVDHINTSPLKLGARGQSTAG